MRQLLQLGRRVQLVEAHEVPSTLREVSIRGGYRKPRLTITDCIVSAVTPLNNETGNFWTHFLPFWYFVWSSKVFWADEQLRADPYHWPFLAYLATLCAWPIVSCMAHLFGGMSVEARHFCFFCDYVSLSCYSFGCALAYHAYSFDERWFLEVGVVGRAFPWAAASAAVFCTLVACNSRFMAKRHFWRRKVARVAAFFVPYAVVSVPLAERVVHCWLSGCVDAAIALHARQFCATTLGMLLYSLHWPERLLPGAFDLLGHSHQLFHVCGVAASYYQMWAIWSDLRARRLSVEASHLPIHRFGVQDSVMLGTVVLADCLIAAAFTYRLCKAVRAKKK